MNFKKKLFRKELCCIVDCTIQYWTDMSLGNSETFFSLKAFILDDDDKVE